MITINVSRRSGDVDVNLGDHLFASTPSTGEAILLYVDGVAVSGVVEQIYHSPRPMNGLGPGGKPGVGIRITVAR